MNNVKYGGDLVIETLRRAGIEYVAMNPGATFRGMHESLVSAGGDPELVLALHENVAVGIGEGYAKSAGKPMGVFLHNLVGLQSGAIGIFNAWADQVPVLIVGGSGPSDAAVRRPWIDWIHSARTQSLVARDFMKWDDEPTSLEAVPDALMRASRIATTVPYGPCYVSVDVLLQEALVPRELIDKQSSLPEPQLSASITAPEDTLEEVVDRLARAESPVIIADYTGKTEAAYDGLLALAESLAIPVVDLGARHNFPTGHWADGTLAQRELLGDADVVLALDLRDLSFGLGDLDHESHSYAAWTRPDAHVVSISTNQLLLRGFMDYSGPTGTAQEIIADTAVCLPVMAAMAARKAGDRRDRRERLAAFTDGMRARQRARAAQEAQSGCGVPARVLSSSVFRAVDSTGEWQIANGHMRGAVRQEWELRHFNAHIGRNIGGGLGHGIGLSIGAALAHRGDDTLIVNLQNDGDLMYTASGLWTAARYELPVLTVMVNNRTYGQDRMHQTITAKKRGRPLEHASVGIDLDSPNIDFAGLARSQGMTSFGPVTDQAALDSVLADAVRVVREERGPALVDVHVPR